MAGFSTAVTGLKAATTMLDVAGNNIANSSTVGFKSSRTEFGDIYATAVVGAGSSNTPGSGVTVTDIAQDFSAGTIEFTNNNLDLAINGSGFFQLNDGQGGVTYTRAGAFELDKEGNIVSKTGKFLQGYGLDDDGNRLPIGNLSVTQKESPPKATETIDLSLNIDAREDASKLISPYDKDEPGSFTYTTTVRSFDSLGNEHTIKYNFVEQPPTRQEFRFTDDAGVGLSTISGVDMTTAAFAGPGNSLDLTTPDAADLAFAEALSDADPRIDVDTLAFDGTDLTFELYSWASDTGEMFVADTAGTVLSNELSGADASRPANEVWSYTLSDIDTGTNNPASGIITIGGVEIDITGATTPDEVGRLVVQNQARILDQNPELESVNYDNDVISVTFKADQGNVSTSEVDLVSVAGMSEIELLDPNDATGATTIADGSVDPAVVDEGDNSYLGHYRMYAYLNGEELLDVGKLNEPGGGTEGSEPGPILISFNPTNGLLRGVNVDDPNDDYFTPGANVPDITIKGADPANELTEITMNLEGTTQFASASIVKASQQDGYTKGDLIGVTFSGAGEMVASYSNGENQSLGVVALATFENQDGLQPSGDTEWIATLDSGDAIVNPPGTGLNGTLRSAALEASNVDLSEELVKLIEGQRNYQANSKTLETMNTVTQAILQI